MSDEPPNPNIDKGHKEEKIAEMPDEWVRCVYQSALETARHSDTVFYEVAAIVWSANTLLMGFILEVPLGASQQRPVLGTAILGLVLTAYVPLILWLIKKGQIRAQHMSREIEGKMLPEWLRLHTQIDREYPRVRGRYAVGVVTVLFTLMWIYIMQRAWVSIVCGR